MNVAICEDNQKVLNQITDYIDKYTFIEENSIKIVLNTVNPYEILEFIENEPIDCVFLDIDLNSEINGLDLAKIIREKYPLVSIIFVTTHSEMLTLTFKYRVEALDFIIKDNINMLQMNVIEALRTAYEKYRKLGLQSSLSMFQMKNSGFIKNIKYEDILYFKVADAAHKVILITTNGYYEFYDSLNEIEKQYEKFVRCHRSYIVNIDGIKEMNKKERLLIMKNDDKCPVSFRRLKAIEKRIFETTI